MKKLLYGVLFLFLLSFVAAHGDYYDDYVFKEKITDTEYFPNKNKVVTTTTYIDYENENRLSTYDYRHGYTYRATKEYLEDRYKSEKHSEDYYERDKRRYDYYDDLEKDYYYEYTPHMRTYEKKLCWHEAPRGQLFYIKCPY